MANKFTNYKFQKSMKPILIVFAVICLAAVIAACSVGRGKNNGVKVAGENEYPDVPLSASPAKTGKVLYKMRQSAQRDAMPDMAVTCSAAMPYDALSTESYSDFSDSRFLSPTRNPLSTFSIDVDVASYANMRRYINQGMLPPADAVRVEELVNYFSYTYPQPSDGRPVHIDLEAGVCPWNKSHRLVKIGLKAKEIPTDKLPAANFVFLIDVSGSMAGPARLGLVKSSMKMLADNIRDIDRVAIVVYGSDAKVVLPSTQGNEKGKIKTAIEALEAGGYTAGEAGLRLAYKTAEENFIEGGNNRIILCSDGDFNFGISDEHGLEKIVAAESKKGIFMSVLGYGMGNYKDSKMQVLAEKGSGNQAYIDNIQEARKVLISEFASTLFTVAEDVKLQVEFNPSQVQAYRLVGYESRMLKDEDFNDDNKDAGDIGAGHTVTALYEVIPVGVKGNIPGTVDALKYQKTPEVKSDFKSDSKEMLTVKLRYKNPGEKTSLLLEKSLTDKGGDSVSEDFRFASAVAMYGQLLRDSDFKGDATYRQVIEVAKMGLSDDAEGYRREFIRLAEAARNL
ncbi:MAG: VWA domain-containing protein [Bacteroidales bacterium]|nr:VWA domain-containing protein [Bacteroidales bacterium]